MGFSNSVIGPCFCTLLVQESATLLGYFEPKPHFRGHRILADLLIYLVELHPEIFLQWMYVLLHHLCFWVWNFCTWIHWSFPLVEDPLLYDLVVEESTHSDFAPRP